MTNKLLSFHNLPYPPAILPPRPCRTFTRMSKFDTSWKAGTSWVEKLGSWDIEALDALRPGPQPDALHELENFAGGIKLEDLKK